MRRRSSSLAQFADLVRLRSSSRLEDVGKIAAAVQETGIVPESEHDAIAALRLHDDPSRVHAVNVEVALLASTELELWALLRRLKPLPAWPNRPIRVVSECGLACYGGTIGATPVVVALVDFSDEAEAHLRTERLLLDWRPKGIMSLSATALKATSKFRLGDVLLADAKTAPCLHALLADHAVQRLWMNATDQTYHRAIPPRSTHDVSLDTDLSPADKWRTTEWLAVSGVCGEDPSRLSIAFSALSSVELVVQALSDRRACSQSCMTAPALGHLSVLDFSHFLRRKSDVFVGRKWLLDQLDAWLDQGDAAPSLAVLESSILGFGRSAFAGELILRHNKRVIAYHIIQFDRPVSGDDRHFVMSVTGRLCLHLPGFVPPKAAQDLAVGEAEPLAAAVALFNALCEIREPPKTTQLIVIDSLGGSVWTLLHELLQVQRLPPWLRIVATMRQTVPSALTFRVTPEQLQADMHATALAKLSEPEVRAHFTEDLDLEAAAAELTRLSANSMLYLMLVVQTVYLKRVRKAGVGKAKADPSGLVTLAMVKQFPAGLHAFYQDIVTPELRSRALPVLQCVGASLSALPTKLLQEAVSSSEMVEYALAQLAPVLRHKDGFISPVHETFPMYLVSKSRVSLTGGDQLLANAGLQLYRSRRDDTPGAVPTYIWRHQIQHMLTGAVPGASDLLLDLTFLTNSLISKDTFAILDDVALVNPGDLDEDLAILWMLLRQTRASTLLNPGELAFQILSHAVVTNSKRQSRLAALVAAARKVRHTPVPLYPLPFNSALVHRCDNPDQITAMCMLPDGDHIAVAAWDTILLYNWRRMVSIKELHGHENGVYGLAAAKDGRLFSASLDKTIKVWEPMSGRVLGTMRGHEDDVTCLALSADEARLVSGSRDYSVRVWDTTSLKQIRCYQDDDFVRCVAVGIGSCSLWLMSGGDNNVVRVWDGARERAALRSLTGHKRPVRALLALPSDESQIVSGSDDKSIRIWNWQKGECLRTLRGHEHEINALAVSLDHGKLFSASGDMRARIWDVKSGECIGLLNGHSDIVSAVVTADESTLLTGSKDKTIGLWGWRRAKSPTVVASEVYLHTQHSGAVVSVSVLQGGTHAVTGSEDTTVRVWEVQTGRCIATLDGHVGPVLAVCGGAVDSPMVISGGVDKVVRSWNWDLLQCTLMLKGHSEAVTCVAYSPGSIVGDAAAQPVIISGSLDRTVRLWSVTQGRQIGVLKGHDAAVQRVVITRALTRIVSGDATGTVIMWNVSKMERHAVITTTSRVVSLSFVTERVLLVATVDALERWAWRDCTQVASIASVPPALDAAAVPGGHRAISCNQDGLIRLWEVSDDAKMRMLRKVHASGAVRCVACVPDNPGRRSRAVTVLGMQDGSVAFHRTGTGIGPAASGSLTR